MTKQFVFYTGIYRTGHYIYSKMKGAKNYISNKFNRSRNSIIPTRDEIVALGSKAAESFGRPYLFGAIATTICAGIVAFKVYNWTFEVQGSAQTKPKPRKKERENPWKKETVELTPCDFPKSLQTIGSKDFKFIEQKIKKNIYQAFCKVDEKQILVIF